MNCSVQMPILEIFTKLLRKSNYQLNYLLKDLAKYFSYKLLYPILVLHIKPFKYLTC